MKLDNNQKAFFALVKAGLWEKEVRLASFKTIDFNEIYRLAEEQAVVGLVAAGIEHVVDKKVPQEVALMFVGNALQLEQRNIAMNEFVAKLFEKLYKEQLNALLIKGQGIAQYYERPLWRAVGDVDLLIEERQYENGKVCLAKYGTIADEEEITRKHIGYSINNWLVELHGSFRSNCWKKLDKKIDTIQEEAFKFGSDRLWDNNGKGIPMPTIDNDVIFVFTHILQHFFKGGIGLRQICDLSRFLYKNKNSIDTTTLFFRLCNMELMSEWRAFGVVSVEYLGMPSDYWPFYSSKRKWERKAAKIVKIIIETGNFGHNRDMSYINKYPFVMRKMTSLWRSTKDRIRQCFIFPADSARVWIHMFNTRTKAAIKGK